MVSEEQLKPPYCEQETPSPGLKQAVQDHSVRFQADLFVYSSQYDCLAEIKLTENKLWKADSSNCHLIDPFPKFLISCVDCDCQGSHE